MYFISRPNLAKKITAIFNYWDCTGRYGAPPPLFMEHSDSIAFPHYLIKFHNSSQYECGMCKTYTISTIVYNTSNS